MYIKDLMDGTIRKYGTNRHDSLRIDENGRFLTYENLQDGDGSRYGDYRFVTSEKGKVPREDEDLIKHGADAYFNIGGFTKHLKAMLKDCRNELCMKCGKYKGEHLGACDGCRWSHDVFLQEIERE